MRKQSVQLDNRMNVIDTQQQGYVILLSVLVVGVIGMAITIAVLQLGASHIQTSITGVHAIDASYVAESCIEEAIEQLRRDSTYAAGDSITFDGGAECTISAVAGTGTTNRTIQVIATSDSITQRYEVIISDVAAPVDISSWNYVESF